MRFLSGVLMCECAVMCEWGTAVSLSYARAVLTEVGSGNEPLTEGLFRYVPFEMCHVFSVRGFCSAQSPTLSAENDECAKPPPPPPLYTLSAESDEYAEPSADEYD